MVQPGGGTAISGLELDSFIITTSTNAAAAIVSGGSAVTCSRNIPMDLMYPQVQTMELPGTTISATCTNYNWKKCEYNFFSSKCF